MKLSDFEKTPSHKICKHLYDKEKEKIYNYAITYQSYKHENETNRTPLVVIVITDVTNERNNDKLKQEFIANASHELKTPITSITGFSEILLMKEDSYDEVTKKYLKIINKESSRMTSIINDMLYLANLQEKEKMPIEIESIDLKELVDNVVIEFEQKILKNNITIINNLQETYIENNYDMLKHIDNKTFVFMDPPYRPLTQSASFNAYNKDVFKDQEQKELAEFAKTIDKLGAKFIVCNSDPHNVDPTDNFFDELYKDFDVYRVSANRMINSKGSSRGSINELLITNYKP